MEAIFGDPLCDIEENSNILSKNKLVQGLIELTSKDIHPGDQISMRYEFISVEEWVQLLSDPINLPKTIVQGAFGTGSNAMEDCSITGWTIEECDLHWDW